jgi:outer membrane protein assembly factor BamB
MTRGRQPLYAGTNGYVLALDPARGEELWRTKLPKRSTGAPTTIVIRGHHLYVGHYGRVFALDRRTGQILWENALPKTGYHAVLLAMEGATGAGGDVVTVARRQRQRQQGAAAGAAAAAAGA